jgi:hypothetical protein
MILLTKTQLRSRIKEIRDELENRYKFGTIKLAQPDGSPIPTETLQNELFSLTLKLSRMV